MTGHKATERLRWAVEMLAVKPTDRLLEIGCGQGVVVSLVCEKLDGGSVTAIDRSQKMIEMARRRNATYVDAGIASFHVMSLNTADLGDARFDTIFAIRVGAFVQGNATRAFEVVKHYLAPGGFFYLIYDPPVASKVLPVIEAASTALQHHGFSIKQVQASDALPMTGVCIIAGKS